MALGKAKLLQGDTKAKNPDQVLLLKVLKEAKCLYIEGCQNEALKNKKRKVAILNLSKIQNIVDKTEII